MICKAFYRFVVVVVDFADYPASTVWNCPDFVEGIIV